MTKNNWVVSLTPYTSQYWIFDPYSVKIIYELVIYQIHQMYLFKISVVFIFHLWPFPVTLVRPYSITSLLWNFGIEWLCDDMGSIFLTWIDFNPRTDK